MMTLHHVDMYRNILYQSVFKTSKLNQSMSHFSVNQLSDLMN